MEDILLGGYNVLLGANKHKIQIISPRFNC